MVWVFHALLLGSLAGDAAVDKSLWRADKQVSEKAVALSPKMSSVCLLPAKCGWLLERLREGVQVDHLCSHHQWCWLWLWPFSAKVSLTRGCRCFVWQSAVFERKKKTILLVPRWKTQHWLCESHCSWIWIYSRPFAPYCSDSYVCQEPQNWSCSGCFFFFFSSPPSSLSGCHGDVPFCHFWSGPSDADISLQFAFVSWCKLAGSTWLLVCDEPLFWSYVGMRRGHCLLACQNFTKTQAGKNTHLFSRQFQWILSLFLRHAIVDLLW